MNINGFNINGEIHKIDYKSLENKPIKEIWITAEEVRNPIYLQNLEAGIYIFKTEDPRNPDIYHTLYAGNEYYEIGADSILMVTGDSILNYSTMPESGVCDIMKHFMLIYEVPYAYYTETIDGMLACFGYENEDGGLDWEIDYYKGSLVNNSDLVSRINAKTGPDRVPTVNAMRTYMAENTFGNIEDYKLYGEYTAQADIYGFYPYNSYSTTDVSLPEMGSTLIYIQIPAIETTKDFYIDFTVGTSEYGRYHYKYNIGQNIPNQTSVAIIKIDATIHGYQFSSSCNEKYINEIKFNPGQQINSTIDYRLTDRITSYYFTCKTPEGATSDTIPTNTYFKMLGVLRP